MEARVLGKMSRALYWPSHCLLSADVKQAVLLAVCDRMGPAQEMDRGWMSSR
jgi:hypothetical protein